MSRGLCAALAVAAVAVCVAGCATKPIAASADSLSRFQGQVLAIVTYDPQARFMHMTATDVQLALIGVGIAANRSKELAKEHGLASPSISLATKLTPILSEKLKPTMVTPIAHTSEGGTSTRALSALAGNRGLVFDVDGGYEANYFAFDWEHYYVRYLGSARLIDASTGNVIAQAPCVIDARDDPNPPTYEQLYADSAMILKTKLQALADACVSRVATALFGN